MSAAKMDRLMAFDAPVRQDNGAGGTRTGWAEAFKAWAEVIYRRGGETAQGGGESVEAVFKVRLRASASARALSGEHTMRDPQTGARYNIREIDALSDRDHVWLVVEGGVAT